MPITVWPACATSDGETNVLLKAQLTKTRAPKTRARERKGAVVHLWGVSDLLNKAFLNKAERANDERNRTNSAAGAARLEDEKQGGGISA